MLRVQKVREQVMVREIVDDAFYESFKMVAIPVNTVTLGLCKGRHSLPVDDYVFDGVLDPMDFNGLEEIACSKMVDLKRKGVNHLVLYVTGLTPCLVAALNHAKGLGIAVDLMHFDHKTNDYRVQNVL